MEQNYPKTEIQIAEAMGMSTTDLRKRKTIEKVITTIEYRYYISSKQVNIKEFKIATRQHWSVENKIHWHLDFTFRQDANLTTNKNSLLNLEIIHKFVLAVLPEKRACKISYQFLSEIEDYCRQQGDKAIHLDVIDSNIPAYKLYIRNGYTEVDCIKMFYEVVGTREFWMMEKIL